MRGMDDPGLVVSEFHMLASAPVPGGSVKMMETRVAATLPLRSGRASPADDAGGSSGSDSPRGRKRRRRRDPEPPAEPPRLVARLALRHQSRSAIRDVGLQLWRGGLLCGDFALSHRGRFEGRRVLELGAGTGLTTMALAASGARVLATDRCTCRKDARAAGAACHGHDCVLGNLQQNLARPGNVAAVEAMARWSGGRAGTAEVAELDWVAGCGDAIACREFDWVVAADCAYQDDLTSAWVRVAKGVARRARERGDHVRVLVAVERREVFTTSEMRAHAPALEHLLTHVRICDGRGGWGGMSGGGWDTSSGDDEGGVGRERRGGSGTGSGGGVGVCGSSSDGCGADGDRGRGSEGGVGGNMGGGGDVAGGGRDKGAAVPFVGRVLDVWRVPHLFCYERSSDLLLMEWELGSDERPSNERPFADELGAG